MAFKKSRRVLSGVLMLNPHSNTERDRCTAGALARRLTTMRVRLADRSTDPTFQDSLGVTGDQRSLMHRFAEEAC
jgi:hypothetical protein